MGRIPHDSGTHLAGYKNFSADDLKAYVDHYMTNSPYIEKGRSLPVGQPTHYEAFVDYHDYVRPPRLGYWGTGVLVERCPRSARP